MSEEMIADRFWSRVTKTDGCWLWGGSANNQGYGRMCVDGKMKCATHVALYLETGEWLTGRTCACHRCDNPPCVRPDHLFVGTYADNNADRHQKGRTKLPRKATPEEHARGLDHGLAKLTEQDVLEIRASSGVSQRRLAARYGVSQKTVWLALKGETWTHLLEVA